MMFYFGDKRLSDCAMRGVCNRYLVTRDKVQPGIITKCWPVSVLCHSRHTGQGVLQANTSYRGHTLYEGRAQVEA